MERVHRSQLKNAPYNPRVISDKARNKLKANLKKVGLVEPIIWNARTGNIVGGHQRISVIDSLEGTEDYTIDVSRVDLDEKQEKEQNIFLNNGVSQGDWDLDKLGSMFKTDSLDFEATGFDMGDLHQLFGDSVIAVNESETVKAAEKLREAHEIMASSSEEIAGVDSFLDNHFYLVVIFRDDKHREKFCDSIGFENNRYIDGDYLISKLGGNAAGPDIAAGILDNG